MAVSPALAHIAVIITMGHATATGGRGPAPTAQTDQERQVVVERARGPKLDHPRKRCPPKHQKLTKSGLRPIAPAAAAPLALGGPKVFVLKVDPAIEAPYVCDVRTPSMFHVEHKIVESLRASPYITQNASEARWVLIAIRPILYQYCFKGRNQTLSWEEAIAKSAKVVNDHIFPWLRTLPYWARRRGKDHLFTFGAGCAPKHYSRITAFEQAGIILTTSYDGPTATLPNVVVVPALVRPPRCATDIVDSSLSAFEAKLTSGYFRGLVDSPDNPHYSYGTRQFLSNLTTRPGRKTAMLPLQILSGRVDDTQFLRELSAARFCLALPGHFAFSPRNVQFLAAGCVPVNVSPFGIVASSLGPKYPVKGMLPYARTMDWDRFSLTIDQAVIMAPGNLRDALLAVPPRRWSELVDGLNAVVPHFIWEVYGGSSWTTLIEELLRLEAGNRAPRPNAPALLQTLG